ncbi:MAG: hypothetical protein Q9187_003448 [Circinaria calcarea]
MPLEAQSTEAPKLIVTPKAISENACILTLAHPRTAVPTRYYFCPETGVYEFTRIAAPKSTYRSLLIAPNHASSPGSYQSGCKTETALSENIASQAENGATSNHEVNNGSSAMLEGCVSKVAELFTVTPMDPLFLIIRALDPMPSNSRSESPKPLFRSAGDLFENLWATSKHFDRLSNHQRTCEILESRMEILCDTVDAGNERMYRLNEDKLVQELVRKARKMVSSGLPASMEEKFVYKALEVPVIGVKREDSSCSGAVLEDAREPDLPTSETTDSQTSTSSLLTRFSDFSEKTNITTPDQPSQLETPPEVTDLLRLKTALSYINSAYLHPSLETTITNLLASDNSPIDFKPLESHLAQIARLRAEAFSSRSLADFSLKRSMNEDDEAAETRAEKKRKKDEEEKRKKAGQSKAVRDLKKVDTTGMKKMSDFFGKGAVLKKKGK